MKKIISAVLIVCILFSVCGLAGCSLMQKKLLKLSSDVKEVSAGEEFTVIVSMKKIKMLACLQFDVSVDGAAELTNRKTIESKDMELMPNTVDGVLVMAAYVATVIDIDPFDFQKLTFKVSEDAKPGDVITVKLNVSQLIKGLDVNGDNTENITDTVSGDTLTVKIK